MTPYVTETVEYIYILLCSYVGLDLAKGALCQLDSIVLGRLKDNRQVFPEHIAAEVSKRRLLVAGL